VTSALRSVPVVILSLSKDDIIEQYFLSFFNVNFHWSPFGKLRVTSALRSVPVVILSLSKDDMDEQYFLSFFNVSFH